MGGGKIHQPVLGHLQGAKPQAQGGGAGPDSEGMRSDVLSWPGAPPAPASRCTKAPNLRRVKAKRSAGPMPWRSAASRARQAHPQAGWPPAGRPADSYPEGWVLRRRGSSPQPQPARGPGPTTGGPCAIPKEAPPSRDRSQSEIESLTSRRPRRGPRPPPRLNHRGGHAERAAEKSPGQVAPRHRRATAPSAGPERALHQKALSAGIV